MVKGEGVSGDANSIPPAGSDFTTNDSAFQLDATSTEAAPNQGPPHFFP